MGVSVRALIDVVQTAFVCTSCGMYNFVFEKRHINYPLTLTENISHSSQCSTTGVTKAVVCATLSVGCI